MSNKKNLKYIIFCMIAAMSFIVAGNAYAQHVGGLGERKILLNIVSEEKLMMIEGMTEELAKAIVEYREEKGFFNKPEDLLKVPGVTKEIYEKLNPQKGVEGDIYCVPMEGMEDEFDEDEEPVLSPSKC